MSYHGIRSVDKNRQLSRLHTGNQLPTSGVLVVLNGVPVALPDSWLTFGDSFLINFEASLTSFAFRFLVR